MKKTTFFLLFLLSVSMVGQTTHTITNPEALTTLSSTLKAGDTVILANGTYTTTKRIKFSPTTGTAASPIIFKAATPGGVVFTGGMQMSIGGNHVIIDGFYWKGGYGASNFIEFRDGSNYANHSKIQNCAIDGLAIEPSDIADDVLNSSITKHRWIVLYGTYNTVTNCSFMNKKSAGALVLTELSYNASPDGTINNRCSKVGHIISNNYFYKYAKIDASLSNSGDSETIRLGSSSDQNVDSSTLVTGNYFVEADGENEIITNKSKNNTFINNTFRRSRGSLVLRHGSNAKVDGNYFLGEDVDGTGGIRISDSDHVITNNYIQDCVTTVSQAKWNNGITFIGGGDSAAVLCTSTSVTNGYQRSENLTISNNSIVNTNAPLFYNAAKGKNDVKGSVANNLIYFGVADANKTNVITGDAITSYNDLGTSLTYAGNVFTGTDLGVTNTGFTKQTGIIATAKGEIFTFSGTGSAGKGANLGNYEPITDAKVGYGVGSCFLNNFGVHITDGICTIVVGDYLTVSNIPALGSDASTNDVFVTANVGWTATVNNAWITANPTSGTGSVKVLVAVAKNSSRDTRTGSITFKQNAGGKDIVQTLTVVQDGAPITDLYDMINPGGSSDPVSVHSFSKQEVTSTKNNAATNTLDKNAATVWAADDGSVVSGDYKGDGEYIIYDLGSTEDLDFLQFSTTNKSDAFGFHVLVATTGTAAGDFTKILPTSGDLLLTKTSTTDFNQFEITGNVKARYVKLHGFGRFDSAGTTRKSAWSAVGEIEFFRAKPLSTENHQLEKVMVMYPNPAKNKVFIRNIEKSVQVVQIFSMDGKKLKEQKIDDSVNETTIDVSTLENGMYLMTLKSAKTSISKMIVISK